MKKLILTFYAFVLVLACSFSSFQTFSAPKYSKERFRIMNSNNDLAMLDSALVEAHKIVEKHNTDVITVLESMKVERRQMLSSTDMASDEELAYYDDAIENYREYLKNKNSSQRNFLVDFSLKAGIDALIVGFKLENWDLSAELLKKMRYNKVEGCEYYPRYGDVLSMTEEITSVVANSEHVVGSGEFNKGDIWGNIPFINHEEKFETDAHYAVNKFNYKKRFENNRVLVDVFDRYDFDKDPNNKLITMCYQAQERGILTPFYTIINNIEVKGKVMFNHDVVNDEIHITKNGNVENCNLPDSLGIYNYKSEIDNEMPQVKVTKIADNAFKDDLNLKQINLPAHLTSIGNSAFANCNNLKIVKIPKYVNYIGPKAFENCSNLTIQIENKNLMSGWDENWNVSNCKVEYLQCSHNYQYDDFSNSQHVTTCSLCDYYSVDPHVANSTYRIGFRTYADCVLCGRQVDLTDTFVVIQTLSVNGSNRSLLENNRQYYENTIILENGVIILGQKDFELFLSGKLNF